MTTHVLRPQSAGSWTFDIHEGTDAGDVIATLRLHPVGGGEIYVGGIPFDINWSKGSSALRLLFEGQTLAKSETMGGFLHTSFSLVVEGAMLASGVEVGDRLHFELKHKGGFSSDYEIKLDGTVWGEIMKESALFRHFELRFNAAIPLALQVFFVAMVLIRIRQQSG